MIGVFEVIGALGLLCITSGVILKKRKDEDILYIIGGILLAVYSIYIKNSIFIILQVVFTIAATYDFITIKKKKRKAKGKKRVK